MFLIFKIFPDWVWWLLLASGLIGVLLSYLPQLKTYALIIKSFGFMTIAATIFILGMLYSDRTWKSAAAELEAKVAALSHQSETVNQTLKERVTTKLQIVKLRGEDVVRYIDREVVKTDGACTITPEFVTSHNRAAEAPK